MCSFLVQISSSIQKWLNQAGGEIRKGMVLLDFKEGVGVNACYSFKADIWSYDGTTQSIK